MRYVMAAALVLSQVGSALAQQPPHQEQALGQQIMACVGESVQLRAKIISLEAEIAAYKKDPQK